MSEHQFAALAVPGPTITPVSQPFWNAIADHEFKLQRCADCSEWVFYPRKHCPHCWGGHLEWQEASGKGHLKTWTIVHRPGHQAWEAVTPYVLGLVELDEGPTMLSHLLVDPHVLEIGLPLKINYINCNGVVLPFFERE